MRKFIFIAILFISTSAFAWPGGWFSDGEVGGNLHVGGKATIDGGIYGDGSNLTGVGASSGWSTDSSTKTTTTYSVGVGSTSPRSALDVNGTVTATAFSGPLTGNVTGSATTVTASSQPAITSVGTLSTLATSGAANIGGALTVAGTGSSTITGSANGLTIDPAIYTDGGIYGTQNLTIGSSNTPVMYLVGSNVGIGSTAPQNTLQVAGTIRSTGLSQFNGTRTGTAYISVMNLEGNDLSINTTGVTGVMTIKNSGNVGINSTTPTSKLAIDGSIYLSNNSAVGGYVLCKEAAATGRLGHCTSLTAATGVCATCTVP